MAKAWPAVEQTRARKVKKVKKPKLYVMPTRGAK
jgi:hypothetical protein